MFPALSDEREACVAYKVDTPYQRRGLVQDDAD